VLDFTSALYLGIEHSSRDLPDWDRLTLGKPAALEAAPGSVELEHDLAALTGCQQVSLAASTLHVFVDLFAMLAQGSRIQVFFDECSYQIAAWGVQRAAGAGLIAAAESFRGHDPRALGARLRAGYSGGGTSAVPIVVADGFCPACGKFAPLAEYVDLAIAFGGLVVIDDTQAIGIFGRRAEGAPYGVGGGGSVSYAGLSAGFSDAARVGGRVITVASLAKAFGAPIALVGGGSALVEQFRVLSKTRMHCSPPSIAAVAAAHRALEISRRFGDQLRLTLASRVSRLRRGLMELGFLGTRGLFPVQSLALPANVDPGLMHDALSKRGVKAVVHASGAAGHAKPRISLVVTARHSFEGIDAAVDRIARAAADTAAASLNNHEGAAI
jgi:8-amino-7-oxononanoate synthase